MALRVPITAHVAATVAALTLISHPTYGQGSAGRAFTPEDWYRVTTVSAPTLSPDGRQIAFTVTTVREGENKRHSEVWVTSASGDSRPRRFTSASTESSAPRWSPDGRYLLFTSQRSESKGGTFGIRMDSPGGEAEEVDRYPAGSTPSDRRFAVWSDSLLPDTTRGGTDPYAATAPMARPPFGAITKPLDPKRFDGRQIVDMRYKGNGVGYIPGARERRVFRPAQVWTQAFDGSPRHVVDTTAYSRRGATVSPDGTRIAFVADARLRPDSVVEAERDSLARLPYDARRENTPRDDADIFIIPVDGGAPRRLTTQNGNERNLAWSPDGKWLSFTSQLTPVTNERLWIISPEGGTPSNVVGNWPYEPSRYWWLPGNRIAIAAAIGGRSALLQLDVATKQLRDVMSGRRQLTGVSIDEAGSRVAFVATSVNAPTELYVANADGSGERKLTTFNDAVNREIAWSDAERFTYRSVGGLEIEAWLVKPFGYDSTKKYPLVLYIHGGPHGQYGENWFDEFQNLAGAGMWVLYTNPRGSSGYGKPFEFATRGRWFAEDYQDLMTAVDIAARRPDVDTTRLGVSGGSYGGVMTAWVTAKTNRFRAAQADRMIVNWWSWYGSSDAQGLTEFEFFGKPWDNPAMYDSLSPLRSIRRVKTPTLIVQSEEDYRAPITDAEQWFMGLKKQGTPAEFVRYPRSNHDLSRTGEPWLLVDRLGRLRQWFGYWLAGTRS